MPKGPLGSVEITLKRGACFGICPVYSVKMKGDGTVAYHGERFVLVDGDHSFQVDPKRIACLVEQFRKADFWSLRPEYLANITDSPFYSLTVTISGQTKVVVDYVGRAAGMPPVVTRLEGAVDAVGGLRWAQGDADTLASLIQGGFVVGSRQGADLLARATERAPDEVVLDLIRAGAPLDGHGVSFSPDVPGATTLETAAARGRATVVRALLQAGALEHASTGLKAAVVAAAKRSGDRETIALFDQRPNAP